MLNFLLKLQDRYFILICFFVVLGLYIFIPLDAILQLAINFGVAIIALSQKQQRPTTEITADSVQTPSVTTETISDSTVNTETLNVENKEKNL